MFKKIILTWNHGFSRHPQFRNGGFCWCIALLPICLCWWQLPV